MSDRVPPRLARWAVRLLIALAVLLVVIAAVGPEIREPWRIVDFEQQNQPPSASYPLGTDALGRDHASRIADGLRSSMIFGLGAAALWGGLCVVVGLLVRQLRRTSRRRTVNVVLDVVIAAAVLGIAIPLCLDWLDPDAGWFQQAGATSSPGYERLVLFLTLYDSSILLFIGIGIALGIWMSRTSFSASRRLRWTLVGLLVLAVLAIRAEPYLVHVNVSPVEPPSATIGALIEERARYSSTEWWTRVPLAALWIALVTLLLGAAVGLASRHLSMPPAPRQRMPVYLVAAGWVIAVTGVIWGLTARPVDEWAYWSSTALAGAGILWSALELRRSWQAPAVRRLYLAAMACALPLATDWPLARLLDFAVPRLF